MHIQDEEILSSEDVYRLTVYHSLVLIGRETDRQAKCQALRV